LHTFFGQTQQCKFQPQYLLITLLQRLMIPTDTNKKKLRAKFFSAKLVLVVLVQLFIATAIVAQDKTHEEAELRMQLKSNLPDTALAAVSGKLAWLIHFTKPDEAVQLLNTELSIGKKYNNANLLADAYRGLGLRAVINKNYQQGISLYDSCIANATKANNYYIMASCISLKAGMYAVFGDYATSIKLYEDGYAFAKKANDKKILGVLSNNLATAYKQSNVQVQKQRVLFKEAKQALIESNSKNDAAMISCNLAIDYAEAKMFTECKNEIADASKLLSTDSANRFFVSQAYSCYADCYLLMNNLDSADFYAEAAYKILTPLQLPDNLMNTQETRTKIAMAKNDLGLALAHANEYLNIATKQKSKLAISKAYKLLATIAEKQNEWPKVAQYLTLHKAWSDSVYNQKQQDAIAQIELKTKVAEQALEAKYQNKNLKSENYSLLNQRYLAIGITLILSLITALSILAYKKSKKLNLALANEKKLIEQQSKNKETMVAEVHHRVKNNLSMLQSLLYLQSKSINDDNAKRILLEAQNRILSMALVHQQLYTTVETDLIDFQQYANDLVADICATYKLQDVEINVTGEALHLDVSKAIPLALIINELVTNSIKYAFTDEKQGKISIDLQQLNNDAILSYRDNGAGLQKEFSPSNGGFGFKVMDTLSKQIRAQVNYTSGADHYFTIKFALS
jgi:two-component system, sensor histidine kinase PdtaS